MSMQDFQRGNVVVNIKSWLGSRLVRISVVLSVVGVALVGFVGVTSAQAEVGIRVDLRVLVLTDGGSNTGALVVALQREGVPATVVDMTSETRPAITTSYLENAAAHEGRFQSVILGSPSALAVNEAAALADYEARYGVRQVDAFVYPSATVGLNTATYSGRLDGSPLAVTPAGLSGPFTYLSGALKIDDFDAATDEVYGYVATPLDTLPAGSSFTPLVSVTAGGAVGSLIGSYAHNGNEELVITAAFNANQQFFEQLAHGIITWATRGVHLGYQRNYFAIQTDDVFLADSRWSSVGHCTPGDDCFGANASLTTPDIRITAADVTNLVAWQQANGFNFDMIFNGGGSEDYVAANGGAVDPVAAAYTANASAFTFINHTYTHPYLGCIQVAPLVAGELWHCATPSDESDPSTTYIDESLVTPTGQTYDPATGFYYASQTTIESQISQNLAWAASHGLPVNGTQLVTGEHSGLAILPEQPADNPFLAPALTDLGIVALAADASRETDARTVGTATTIPRHPLNIFYNAATYADEVSEYNWIYTSVANGGSGICTAHPDTTTCITPLPDATATEARTSFDTYIRPLQVRNALSDVLANDPRPFYVHQSNFTEERIIYPVVSDILASYRAVYRSATTPTVHLDLLGQSAALGRMTAWQNQDTTETQAYVDSSGVHVQSSGSAAVPLTLPTDAATTGAITAAMSAYGGEKSGWITAPSTDTVVAVPATPTAGYVGVPDAPAIGTATAGNATATVTWTQPLNSNGSPITSYTVSGFLAGSATASVTKTVIAPITSTTITGLLNFASYAFSVTASNATGPSTPSALSNSVITMADAPAAPAAPVAVAGDTTAALTWTAPADGGLPINGYTIKAYAAGAATYTLSATAPASDTGYTFSGLTNGTAYTFTVTATNAVNNGGESPHSNSVTPTVPGIAPSFTSAATAAFSAGQASTFAVTTAGTPAAPVSQSGALPAGVTFVAGADGTATLAGTPAAGSQGTYSLTLTAANGVTPTATQTFTLTVNSGLSITSAASAPATGGAAFSFTVTTSGTPAPVVTRTGTLPPGVTFTANANGTATLAGTPTATASGTYPLTFTAKNTTGTTSQLFTLTVNQKPAFGSAAGATETAGTAFSFTVNATGYPAPALTQAGALPAGVSFTPATNGMGTLSGTSAVVAGTTTMSFTATNAGGTTVQAFTLTVKAKVGAGTVPAFTSAGSASVAAGTALLFQIKVTGTATVAITRKGTLPAGVSFSNLGNGTATLVGVPTGASGGSYPLTFTARNAAGSTTQAFVLTVAAAPTITSPAQATATVGSAFNLNVRANGAPAAVLTETGALPSGITFVDNGAGVGTLSGTPTGAGGTFAVSFMATNSGGFTTQRFTLTVNRAVAITSASTVPGKVRTALRFTITATGNPVPSITRTGGTLPRGVSFSNNGNGTATLSGSPTVAGTYSITVTAKNNISTTTQTVTITVAA
ncbi:MAG: hypothetical protein JWM76_2404 [Pseudonocardiales bacterium]|nr:hypothetical protein [Pseudonocardiales bacterium]